MRAFYAKQNIILAQPYAKILNNLGLCDLHLVFCRLEKHFRFSMVYAIRIPIDAKNILMTKRCATKSCLWQRDELPSLAYDKEMRYQVLLMTKRWATKSCLWQRDELPSLACDKEMRYQVLLATKRCATKSCLWQRDALPSLACDKEMRCQVLLVTKRCATKSCLSNIGLIFFIMCAPATFRHDISWQKC